MFSNSRPWTAPALCILAGAANAAAGVPTYAQFDLYARTNFAANPGGAFRLPGNYFFSGENIALNDHRQVSFHLSVTTGDFHSVWFGEPNEFDGINGSIVYDSPDDAFLSNTTINNQGVVVWEEADSTTDGVYAYNSNTGVAAFLMNRPLGCSDWGTPIINDAGQVGFRGRINTSNGYFSWDPAAPAQVAEHAFEIGLDPLSPFSFLFTPSFNNNRQIASSARLGPGTAGSNPDEIRVWNPDGSSILIAQDDDADPMSPYASFDNSPALNNLGQVAFVATLFNGERGVFLSDGASTITIALESTSEVSDIEFFGPDVNDNGLVTFRAFDDNGLRAIWVGDGNTLTRVVTEHDILPSDLGPARVDQNVVSSPVFGGAPAINNNGDVAFNCGLTPPDDNQVEWGSGVYVARATVTPTCPGDIAGPSGPDGQVNIDDLNAILSAFGALVPAGDPRDLANSDSMIDIDDLNVILANFGCN